MLARHRFILGVLGALLTHTATLRISIFLFENSLRFFWAKHIHKCTQLVTVVFNFFGKFSRWKTLKSGRWRCVLHKSTGCAGIEVVNTFTQIFLNVILILAGRRNINYSWALLYGLSSLWLFQRRKSNGGRVVDTMKLRKKLFLRISRPPENLAALPWYSNAKN